MNLQQLRYLVGVADHGSMSAAARHAYVSQPTLSRALRQLEHELDLTLFEASGRTLTLTGVGESAARRARDALALIDDLGGTTDPRPNVTVAGTASHLAVVSRAMPRLQLEEWRLSVLASRDAAEALGHVSAGRADLAFVEQTEAGTRLPFRSVGWRELVIACSPSTATTDAADLAFAIPTPGSTRRRPTEQLLQSFGLRPRIALESDDQSMWVAAARSGAAAFITFRDVVPDDLDARPFDPPILIEVGYVALGLGTTACALVDAVAGVVAELTSAAPLGIPSPRGNRVSAVGADEQPLTDVRAS